MTARHAFPYLLFLFAIALAAPLAARLQEQAEVRRIQTHLARAERLALSHDVSLLTPAQRASRARHLSRLESYRERGLFPHNDDFADRRVPYFVDRAGTRCAMAYLIEESGRADLVEHVARTRNNATVRELAADPEIGPALGAWLADAGLSVDEAQAIQPEYDGKVYPPLPPDGNVIPSSYAVGSVTLGVINLASFGFNSGILASRPSPGLATAGLITGLAGVGLGVGHLGRERSDGLAWTSIMVGAASAVAGTTSLVRSSREAKVAGDADGWRVAPFYGFDGRARPVVGLTAMF